MVSITDNFDSHQQSKGNPRKHAQAMETFISGVKRLSEKDIYPAFKIFMCLMHHLGLHSVYMHNCLHLNDSQLVVLSVSPTSIHLEGKPQVLLFLSEGSCESSNICID